jgi:hypothetical protein
VAVPEQIHWTLNVQVVGGPKISRSRTETVDAYDKITVDVPPQADGNPGRATVEVQPGGVGQVRFLLIESSVYDAEDLTYGVSVDATPIALDTLQVLIGAGVVGLLGAAPQTMTFSNKLTQVAAIQILVGRDATS